MVRQGCIGKIGRDGRGALMCKGMAAAIGKGNVSMCLGVWAHPVLETSVCVYVCVEEKPPMPGGMYR